jgi:hypothetical protein
MEGCGSGAWEGNLTSRIITAVRGNAIAWLALFVAMGARASPRRAT